MRAEDRRAGFNLLSLSAYFLQTRSLPELETRILLVLLEASEPPVSTSVGAGVGIHGILIMWVLETKTLVLKSV